MSQEKVQMGERTRLCAITGWKYKWILEIKRGAFRSFALTLRRELKRWL